MKYHLLDLDGTVADSMPKWAAKMIHILEVAQVTYPDDLIRIITPMNDEEFVQYYRSLGVKMSREEIYMTMDKYALDDYKYNIPLKEGVKEYLQNLRNANEYIAMLTASPHRYVDPLLKRTGVYDLFDVVWSTEDFGSLGKNTPEIYFEAAKRMNCKPEDIIFYDDNILALTNGKKAGVQTVGIYDETSKYDTEKIRSVTDRFVYSFSELL